MEKRILRAKIISAERNNKAIVECPKCKTHVQFEVKHLEEIVIHTCPQCNTDFKFDIKNLLSKINWI